MSIRVRRHTAFLLTVMTIVLTAGCSTQKNTSRTRWWHAFNTRYNVYYNGAQAYIDASLEKENGNKDNYTELLPMYTVGNKASRELGKGNYDRAIEKAQKSIRLHSIKKRPEWTKNRRKTARDIEWLNRREYNPFLWKAWMLLGRSQFMEGSFDEAASTFAYMARLYATQPAIYGRARAWLTKCYIESGWLYDAEDVITKIRRDSLHWRAVKEWDYTYTDYYLHSEQWEKAIPYLRKSIRHEMRRKQRARLWYIMGQVEAMLGRRDNAYRAFRHVVRLNPPYELAFNARIAMTEVLAGQQSEKMIKRLRRMASSENNKDYLDQVYYAIGNIYLSRKDTAKAISAYENGCSKATRSGIEKGVLLLHLGDLYWQRESYSDARRCYGEAIGLLDKERKDYEQLSERSKVLDELVPHTEAVHLQDSLQSLAAMSEKDRNAAIDRVIDALKKKEKAERDAQLEAEAQQKISEQGGTGNISNSNTAQTTTQDSKGAWYFYNPLTVSQGKATFQKLWGRRENVDNWQRVNKTVVAQNTPEEELTDEQRDSIAHAEAVQDSLENVADSAQNDPHRREYYLAQIPFTPEQVSASNKIIEDGLYNAGVIFKDKLDNLGLSEKFLRRLTDHYTDYEHTDDALYHLFLLYSRLGNKAQADSYLSRLSQSYPDSKWTVMLTDPYYYENARYGTHIEDSLYAATYDAFKAAKYREVAGNAQLSETRFPMGANRDKFIFIGGLSKLNAGDAKGCVADMETVVSKYPQSGVSEMAGMIINGVKAGRQLHGGTFDIGDVWERRAAVLEDKDSTKARTFTAERNTGFSFLIVYKPDSVDANKMLFELARYNFTNFLVRNFDIITDELNGLGRMRVGGFRSYDEALQYARQLYANESVRRTAAGGRAVIISDENLELLGTQYSYKDYDAFYEKHFVPLRISTVRLLTEPETIEYLPSDNAPADNGGGNPADDGELYNGGVIETPKEADDNSFSVEDNTTATPVETETEGIIIETTEQNKTEEPKNEPVKVPEQKHTAQPAEPAQQPVGTAVQPVETAAKPVKPALRPAAKQQTAPVRQSVTKPETTVPKKEDTGIDFNDDFIDIPANTPKSKKKDKKKNATELEDEYYDLGGF